jgi:hypothetical protein
MTITKPKGIFPMPGIKGDVGWTSHMKLVKARMISEEAFAAKAKELGFEIEKFRCCFRHCTKDTSYRNGYCFKHLQRAQHLYELIANIMLSESNTKPCSPTMGNKIL